MCPCEKRNTFAPPEQLFRLLVVTAGLVVATILGGCLPSKPATPQRFATTVNSIGMKFVHLPGGRFLMGGDHAKPVHRVRLSRFWIGQFEVTNAQFEQFRKRPRPPESLADDQPVTRVSWNDAVAFCHWLSKKEDKKYRLPTEAEWEYAARGGLIQKPYPWGDDSPDGRAALAMSAMMPVGSYAPNGYGLYDMAGNVAEYVSDWYDENYYAHSPLQDPQGPAKPLAGNLRLRRGGFFSIFEGACSFRQPWVPSLLPDISRVHEADERDGSGFRVVLEAASQGAPSQQGSR